MNNTARAASWRHPARLMLLGLGFGLVIYALSDHPMYGGRPGFGTVQVVFSVLGAGLVGAAFFAPLRAAAGLLISAISSLALLALLEVVGERLVGSALRRPYRYDKELLFALRPGVSSTKRMLPENGGEEITHRINSSGFRGPELAVDPEVPRVFVYGDSFIHAAYTSDEETFVAQLQARLERAVGPVEVVNAGVSSYGPDQILLRLERELELFRPDVVVVAVFAGNDYGDLLRNKLFRVGEDGRLEPNDHVLDEDVREGFEVSHEVSILVKALSQIAASLGGKDREYSIYEGGEGARYALVDFWLERAREEHQDTVVNRNPVVTNTHVDHYNADLSLEPSSASARYKAELMGLVVGAIAEKSRAANVPLLLVSIPHPMDVAPDYEYSVVDREKYPGYDPRNLIEPIIAASQRLGVPHVDLHTVFSSQTDPRGLYLKGGDDHWNVSGQRVAAATVAATLERLGWLDRGGSDDAN